MTVVSVCATHLPIEVVDALDTGGVLRAPAAELARIRTDSAAHIGVCGRGPIVAIPVAEQ